MAVIQKEVVVNAGEVVENLLAGSAFEFARTNQVVSMGIGAGALGILVTIQSGSDIVLEESSCGVLARYPIIPDEMYYNDVSAQGDRLVIRVRNSSAGALTVRCIVQITPI